MSYVLTVVHNGSLEHVDLFAGLQMASDSARLWAKAYVLKDDLVDLDPEQEKGDDFVIWRFADTNKTQVSVRFLTHAENSIMPFAKGPPAWKAVQALAVPALKPTPPVTSPPMSSATKDDPYADNLPGGWSYPDNKPITMKQLKDGNIAYRYLNELSQEQLWALAVARVAKRPNVLFLINPNLYPACDKLGLYGQKYALEELKAKTSTGIVIRNMELEHLYSWLGDGEESEDPQMMEEVSSSSDSFDHY